MIDILTLMDKDQIIKIRNRSETIKVWEAKCKQYHTTPKCCACTSFSMRQWCNHQGYLFWKNEIIMKRIKISKNNFFLDLKSYSGRIDKLSDKYSEEFIKMLKAEGEIIESRIPDTNTMVFMRLN